MAIELHGSSVVKSTPSAVYEILRDLSTYPQWVHIVESAVEEGSGVYDVTLRATIGPFARSKRLRMRRVLDEADAVEFVREELDGKRHAHWQYRASICADEMTTVVNATLVYGGALWIPGSFDRVIADQIDQAGSRLDALIDAREH